MGDPLLTFLKLIYPFLLGVICLVAVFLIRKSGKSKPIPFSFLDVIKFELPLTHFILIRIIFLLMAIFWFSFPAFRDYSGCFPTHFEMDVFFDDKGIEKSFELYTSEEIKSLGLHDNWKFEKSQYLKKLSTEISKLMKIDNFFGAVDHVNSKGNTTFFVEKIKGWQKYHIKRAEGRLNHLLDRPKSGRTQFYTRFELMDTGANFITVNLADIYFKYTKVLSPCFKQIAALNPGGDKEIYHHYVIALIKVRFFPMPEIGNTIYLVKGAGETSWVPMGYAIYRPSY